MEAIIAPNAKRKMEKAMKLKLNKLVESLNYELSLCSIAVNCGRKNAKVNFLVKPLKKE